MRLLSKIILIACCLFFTRAYSQEIISFRISKTYCLLNFMQTASGATGTSVSLKKYIDDAVYKNDSSFHDLVKEYTGIRLNYNFRRDEIPASRHQNRSTYDIISNAAVKSANIDDLRERISGLLPNQSLQKLVSILKKAEPVYDRILWNAEYDKLLKQAEDLRVFTNAAAGIFNKLKTFYGTAWDDDFPFIVALYPIPGKNVTTTATPHGNSLCVGVPTEETDHERRMGVIIHEICHILYDEQPAALQQKLDHYLSSVKSAYQPFAGYYIDEAMATACGNGWAKSILTAKQDTGNWYNNTYINGFAHGIYNLTCAYINNSKKIDSSFVSEAVKIFEIQFPKAIYDYTALLNKIVVYTDVETEAEIKSVMNTLYKNFTISSSNMSAPILHELSINTLKNSTLTQLLIIDREHEKTLQEIETIFPELKAIIANKTDENFAVSFYDHPGRPIVILRLQNIGLLEKAVTQLKHDRYFSAEQPYRIIE